MIFSNQDTINLNNSQTDCPILKRFTLNCNWIVQKFWPAPGIDYPQIFLHILILHHLTVRLYIYENFLSLILFEIFDFKVRILPQKNYFKNSYLRSGRGQRGGAFTMINDKSSTILLVNFKVIQGQKISSHAY